MTSQKNNLNISKTTWDLTPLYGSDSDHQMETDRQQVTELINKFEKKWRSSSDYLTSPAILKEALDEMELIDRQYGNGDKLEYYFGLRTSTDMLNIDLKAKENKVDEFVRKNANKVRFFYLNLSKINPKLQTTFLSDPSLSDYQHFLEQTFAQAKYLLSEPEEKILLQLNQTSIGNWTRMSQEFLSKEERKVETDEGKKTQTFEELLGLFNSKNKSVRDGAADAFNDILIKNLPVIEHEINSVLQYKKEIDELRGYGRPDQARHISDDIDTEVVDALIDAVSSRNDLARRFYKLKANVLNVPKLGYHERNIEIGGAEKKVSYQEAVDLVDEVFAGLDQEFEKIFRDFVENGRIDAFPKKGKASGAFCAHDLKGLPVYVLLNFTENMTDVRTIAHEMGHAINSTLSRSDQNSLNCNYPMSTAEVASTFMEDFVLQELLKTADEETKLIILMNKLNDDVSTVFRQVAFYRFEAELHQRFRESGYLPVSEIGLIFQKYMKEYMGDYVEHPAWARNWWTYVSHFRYFFYVYSYASGMLISKSLQASVKNDSKFINKVKNFLSAGSSDSPKNIFAKMDIDITNKKFWEHGLTDIEQLLNNTETLAKKLGKIS
jgi:oligoendopeptidase F